MSRRNKLQKFADLVTFPNVYESFSHTEKELSGQHGKVVSLRGQWAQAHFGNDRPITLELACGRGEYTVALATHYPERNFIGVDVKGARIWKGARHALEQGLGNAAFLRTRIEQLANFFEPGEVAEIWITFPDPFINKESRRLTAPGFMQLYRQVMAPQGLVHLKTDSRELYDFTQEILRLPDYPATLLYACTDIYNLPELPMPELRYKTHYEALHLGIGKTITYTRMQMKP